MAKIFIIDDEKPLRQAMAQILQDEGHTIIEAKDGSQGLKIIKDSIALGDRLDLVFLDLKMPRTQGMTVLKNLGKILFELPVIVMTAYGTSRTAIEAMQLGAYDYLTKPFDLDTLVELTKKALSHHQASVYRISAETLSQNADEMLGRSPLMQNVFKLIGRIAQGDSTVILLGESGTGKELVASMLHTTSSRSKGPLVKVNCAALPEHLLEAELFGHEKGAFTGADHLRIGRFEQANGGTLFLDEIGELTPVIQSKLLRVLQDRSFERLGSNQTRTVDVRILAATNRNLEEMVRSNQFREDLYYRLNVVRVELPALRDRIEDINLLTQHFLSRIALKQGYPSLAIAETAMKKLQSYPFPGNVRELQNILERAAVLSGGRPILPEHLIFTQNEQPQLNLAQAVAQLEQDLIRRALLLDPQEPHKALGLDQQTFIQKRQQWNL
ncbi:sigma-54-dependent transcriptional regulator [Chroogloeocystis siderophila]|jgi:two-component system response regulator AtoC|uniref:DNA-binding transcriptional regulator NtrC n=1 Tax=Chroogloeocystis siderophila 5.2 s.c.1 TaxID=247279 RepID=A0A1U7HDL1_9CHRO|nr:sigma-54 dependent transcriptional regulator [Chroogloeocystis siderophila]OKH21631.1 two-component system response regulator [Chroogloeocystis siderophila 5.2 s.c.1]